MRLFHDIAWTLSLLCIGAFVVLLFGTIDPRPYWYTSGQVLVDEQGWETLKSNLAQYATGLTKDSITEIDSSGSKLIIMSGVKSSRSLCDASVAQVEDSEAVQGAEVILFLVSIVLFVAGGAASDNEREKR